MKTTDFIRAALETSSSATLGLIADMKNAPLTQPTSKGGNHPLWILGHLAYGEANIVNQLMLDEPNPLAEWKELFGGGSQPVADLNHYPPFDDLLAKFEEVRARTLSILDGLSDADLDQPSKGCPVEYRAYFGTVGKCFVMLSLHPTMHYGQVADSRRVLGRKPLVA